MAEHLLQVRVVVVHDSEVRFVLVEGALGHLELVVAELGIGLEVNTGLGVREDKATPSEPVLH